MKRPCPYRAEHEWDADGLCVHCYVKRQDVCLTHRFRFDGMVYDADNAPCVWCGKPMGEALAESRKGYGL